MERDLEQVLQVLFRDNGPIVGLDVNRVVVDHQLIEGTGKVFAGGAAEVEGLDPREFVEQVVEHSDVHIVLDVFAGQKFNESRGHA